eukprot:520687_1
MSSFADLEKCIQANISAPNNEIRAKAESHLKQLKSKYPQQFFEGLSQCIAQSKDCDVRSFCAVLLKRNLGIFDETFFKLPIHSQNKIKQTLLTQIECEQNLNVSTQIAESVSHLMCLILQNKNVQWKELMPSLFKLSSSDIPHKRAAFYTAIDKLACNALDILRCSNMEQLRDILISGLRDKTDIVRESALGAVVALLCSLTDNQELNFFMNLVPLLFNNINSNMSDKAICNTCQSLQTLAENQPNFFVHSMQPIVECLVAVSTSKGNTLQWDTRKLSMHLLLTLLNYHSNQIHNNLLDVGKKVIPLLFNFLSTFDENLEWNTPQDDAEQINYLFGAEMLPLVVSIFGADIFLNVTKPLFDAGFSADNADWKQRLIALKTVEVTLEGAVEHYEQELNYIVQSTGQSLSCGNHYVQYAALSVIKQLSVILGDDKSIFLMPFADPIMNALGVMLRNASSHHRCVLIQVCDALAHFAYMDEENEVITKYASSVLKGLFGLLKSNDNLIASYALKAISVITSVIQEDFAEFYPDLMKYLKDLLRSIYDGQVADESGLLRGRCMECIGGMVLVVSVETCRADAHDMIKYLLPFQAQEEANASSESYTYMMALFASIAEALSTEFVPYLQHVMPPLLQCAQKQTMTVGLHNKEEEKENANNGIVVEQFGGIKFQVNTADLNEKSIAIQQFPRYAVCLEGELLQFVKPISQVLIPIIKTRALSSEVRRHAFETFTPLVNCLKCGLVKKNLSQSEVDKWCSEFAEELLLPLIDGMNVSDEVDEFSLICKTVQELLDYVDCGLFKNASIISDITEQIRTAMDERQTRRMLNEEESLDMIDAEVEEDVEADLADTIVDLVTKLVRKFGGKYVAIFDKYCGKMCTDLLSDSAIEADLILALSMLTEVMNHGGQCANQKYGACVLAFSQRLSCNVSAPIRQSICYAIGICAATKALNANHVPKWLELLKGVVDAHDSRSEDNQNATENAISAIAKICHSYEQKNNQFVVDWMKMLPLIYDDEERQFCNEYLLSILQKTSLLRGICESNNPQMIAKLVHIIGVALLNEDKAKTQFVELFEHLKAKCKADIIQQSIQNLDNNDLHNAFKQYL